MNILSTSDSNSLNTIISNGLREAREHYMAQTNELPLFSQQSSSLLSEDHNNYQTLEISTTQSKTSTIFKNVQLLIKSILVIGVLNDYINQRALSLQKLSELTFTSSKNKENIPLVKKAHKISLKLESIHSIKLSKVSKSFFSSLLFLTGVTCLTTGKFTNIQPLIPIGTVFLISSLALALFTYSKHKNDSQKTQLLYKEILQLENDNPEDQTYPIIPVARLLNQDNSIIVNSFVPEKPPHQPPVQFGYCCKNVYVVSYIPTK